MNYKLEVLVNYVESLEEENKDLEKQIEELKKEIKTETEEKKYPKVGEPFYMLRGNGTIELMKWKNMHTYIDYWDFGSGFFTEEDAEFERERRNVEREMKPFSKKFKYEADNLFLSWDERGKYISHVIFGYQKIKGLCFESVEKINEMLRAVGVDRVKKYYLGVDDE